MDFNGKLVLAPLAGVTDSIYRTICRRLGADLTWSEMVSSDGLVHSPEKTGRLLFFTAPERPIGLQLFGADPAVMGRATALAAVLEPDFIDLNFGCPVPKVVKKNGGAALLRDPGRIGKIACEAVRNSGGIPVTAKLRSGWSANRINFLEVAGELIQAGVSALVLHPRTREQGFSGHSDWSRIKELVQYSAVPVIGSGDVFTPADVQEMFRTTGCAAVMIGRAALGNPWIFSRARAVLEGLADPGAPPPEERFSLALEHARRMADEHGEIPSLVLMRKHFGWYTRGLPESAELRRRIFSAANREEISDVFNQYLEGRPCIRTV